MTPTAPSAIRSFARDRGIGRAARNNVKSIASTECFVEKYSGHAAAEAEMTIAHARRPIQECLQGQAHA